MHHHLKSNGAMSWLISSFSLSSSHPAPHAAASSPFWSLCPSFLPLPACLFRAYETSRPSVIPAPHRLPPSPSTLLHTQLSPQLQHHSCLPPPLACASQHKNYQKLLTVHWLKVKGSRNLSHALGLTVPTPKHRRCSYLLSTPQTFP